MITGIRSALLCEKVEETALGANYIGLVSYRIRAGDRPGLVDLWLALQLEVDDRPSTGHVHVAAAGYDERYPIDFPAWNTLAGMAFPMVLPVMEPGPLIVTVVDDRRGAAKPWRFKWSLEFAPDAEPAGPEAAGFIISSSREAADMVRKGMRTRGA